MLIFSVAQRENPSYVGRQSWGFSRGWGHFGVIAMEKVPSLITSHVEATVCRCLGDKTPGARSRCHQPRGTHAVFWLWPLPAGQCDHKTRERLASSPTLGPARSPQHLCLLCGAARPAWLLVTGADTVQDLGPQGTRPESAPLQRHHLCCAWHRRREEDKGSERRGWAATCKVQNEPKPC